MECPQMDGADSESMESALRHVYTATDNRSRLIPQINYMARRVRAGPCFSSS